MERAQQAVSVDFVTVAMLTQTRLTSAVGSVVGWLPGSWVLFAAVVSLGVAALRATSTLMFAVRVGFLNSSAH